MQISKTIILSIFLILSPTFLFSQKDLLVDLDKYKQIKYYDFENALSSIEFLVLQDNNNCIVGKIVKAKIAEEFVVVMHEVSKVNNIDCFDLKSGRHITKIGTQGKGPGEYNQIEDFDVYDKIIYILDRKGGSIIKSSLQGRIIQTLNIGITGRGIGILDKDNIVLSLPPLYKDEDRYSIVHLNSRGEVSAYDINLDDNDIEVYRSYPFSRYGNDLIYIKGLDQNILTIGNNSKDSFASIKLGDSILDLDGSLYRTSSNSTSTRSWITEGHKSKKPHYIRNYHLVGSYLYFQFSWNGPVFTALININTDDSRYGSLIDKDLYPGLIGARIVGSFNNSIIWAQEAIYYNDRTESYSIDGVSKLYSKVLLSDQLSNLDSESNPILFFLNFK